MALERKLKRVTTKWLDRLRQKTAKGTAPGCPEIPVNENSFRVLTVIQNEPEIVTTLTEHNFEQPPEYHAISYAWSHEEPVGTIICNGKPLAVTPDLLECLRCLSAVNGCQNLWIDAICIDQEDDEEKAHQVANMHKIYRQATDVYVWLGPAEDSSDFAMSIMTTLGDKFGDVLSNRESLRWEIIDFGHGLLRSDPSIPQLLWKFYQSPWFRRLWAYQGVVLA